MVPGYRRSKSVIYLFTAGGKNGRTSHPIPTHPNAILRSPSRSKVCRSVAKASVTFAAAKAQAVTLFPKIMPLTWRGRVGHEGGRTCTSPGRPFANILMKLN